MSLQTRALVASTLFSLPLATAQSWSEIRSLASSLTRYERVIPGGVTESGQLFADRGGATLSWSVGEPFNANTNPYSSQNPVTCTLPFDVQGASALGAFGAYALLSGASASNEHGMMCVVQLIGDANGPARSMQVVHTVDYGPTLDPSDFVWLSAVGELYVRDFHSGDVLCGMWDGYSAPPPLGAMQLVMQGLPGTELWHLMVDEGALLLAPSLPYDGHALRIDRVAPSQWVATSIEEAPPPNTLTIHNLSYLAAGQDVHVKSLDTGPVELLDADSGAVLHTTQIAAPDTWVAIPGGLFSANGTYRLALNGHVNEVTLLPFLRWGDAGEAAASNVMCGRGDLSWPGPALGFDEFLVTGWVGLEDPVGVVDESALVVLLLGLGGSGPGIIQIGGFTQMANPLVIAGPWAFHMNEDVPSHSFHFEHPIPSDPGLIGTVPIYQWGAFASDGTLVSSDVFGSPVH